MSGRVLWLASRASLPLECIALCGAQRTSSGSRGTRDRRTFATDLSGPARVRFAPSPTGKLHLGGLRTALFNYLLARKTGGSFILRIEDTDQSRLVPGAVEHIQDMLTWAGLDYDEGPRKPEPYGPYFQSQRLQLYRDHAAHLLETGRAYRCFCTAAQLESARARATHGRGRYDGTCARLSSAESDARARDGQAFTIRLKIPQGSTSFRDLVYGNIGFQNTEMDDSILLKSDGWPTYHLANVVDDHLMQISHVMRGEEWITSTPKHIILYESFGWKPPQFAHLPLLHNPDRSKLSKRHGDVHVEVFKEKGYLPAALLNFVALLGWSPENLPDTGYMTLPEMVQKFDLSRVGNAGAVVAYEKLDSLNKAHLAKDLRSDGGSAQLLDSLRAVVKPWEPRLSPREADIYLTDAYLTTVLNVVSDKMTVLSQLEVLSRPFFIDPDLASKEAQAYRAKLSDEFIVSILTGATNSLQSADFTSLDALKSALERVQSGQGVSYNQVMPALRWALSGTRAGVGILQMLKTVGKERTLLRLQRGVESIRNQK